MKSLAQVQDLFDKNSLMMILACIFVIIVSVTLYKILVAIINKSEAIKESKAGIGKKSKTYITFVKNMLRLFFIATTALLILQILGVNVSSILAGLGIVGVVAGLALQDWLKDMVRGSSILSDTYCSVGDIVKYGEMEGEVLLIGLMTTKIRELSTGYIFSIANRRIEEIALASDKLYITLPLPYEMNLHTSDSIISEVVKQAKQNKNIKKCEYLGVSELSDFAMQHLLEITCKPSNKGQAKRSVLQIFILEMEKRKIAIPYNKVAIVKHQ
ncbi:MAG: mechanosensitive ion channel family protein [Clostridiales bacterium]|nr:mechanosensitive ion channel family protein [Clostridiales bacterium]